MRSPLPALRGLFVTGRASGDARPIGRRRMRRRRAHLRRRRIKAVLAGGLVFGIGAAGTVAAWTDTETADGSFEAGTFNIELSVDDEWTSSKKMTFESSPMFPGSEAYAPVFVRTSADTSIAGDLTVSGSGIDGTPNAMASALTYRAVTQTISAAEMSGYSCGASRFEGSPSFVFGSAASGARLSAATTGASSQRLSAQGSSVQAYCFEVTLPDTAPSSAQGQTVSHTWTFEAESGSPKE